MANTVISLKKSGIPSSIPSNLANGELAINYADGKLYYKAANGTILSFSGNEPNFFGSVNANNTLVVADTPSDIFTLEAGPNITITGDAINDKITVGLTNDVSVPGLLSVTASSGDEGGEIRLANAITNSLLAGPVNIDIFRNQLRFFVSGGDARGAFINLAACASTVGTDLLAGATGTDTVARTTANQAFDKANAALPNVSGAWFNGTLTASQNLVADKIISTNNGNGENFKVGDDAWIGDTNLANTLRIKGQQNASIGYVMFGPNDGKLLGRAGTDQLTYDNNIIWHQGNDGTSSGLDADLLDGQHGSYYGTAADVAAAFLKANTANITADKAFNQVNIAFAQANAAYDFANNVSSNAVQDFNTAYNLAINAYDFANSSHQTANLAYTQANLAFLAANNAVTDFSPAFIRANLAHSHANAAFEKANSALSNTSGITFNGNLTISQNLSADSIISRHNELGENFKVGDDAWIGDVNIANTIRIKGQQNTQHGFISFGDQDTKLLGRQGTGALTFDNNIIWHQGNDGTGSGLDADLLDGQQGTYYGKADDLTAAYGHANAAFNKANTANITADRGWNHANASYAFANSSHNIANLAFTHANAAFAVANTSGDEAEAAFIRANLAHSHANASFLSSNSLNTYTNSTYVKLTSPNQTITGDIDIVGTLTLSGNTVFIDATRLQIDDPLIYLAGNNYTSDIVDIGFIANYVNTTGQNVHTGLYREHETKEYYLFQGYDQEPINNHIGAFSNNMTLAILNADIKTSNLILGGANAILTIGAAFNAANTSGTEAEAAFLRANLAHSHANAAFDKANSTTYASNVVISVTDNTNAALRITQTGTGEAIRIEDEANPDANAFIVDSTGRVGIGTSPTAKLQIYDATAATFQINGDSTVQQVLTRYSTDTLPTILNFRKSRGTLASPTTGATGDEIGRSNYSAYDGSTFQVLSQIQGFLETYNAANDLSGYLRFVTRPTGLAATALERMRIQSTGNVLIGRTDSTVGSDVRLDISGAANASNLLVNGNMVFTHANDGTGSGLDADLLDGQQGSYYGTAAAEAAAFLTANIAYAHANASFAKANSALANTADITTAGGLIVSGALSVQGSIQGKAHNLPDTGASAQWVKLGTFTAPQAGRTIRIRAYIHAGYNASNAQDLYLDIFFKTSNGVSVDSNGFAGNSWYFLRGFNTTTLAPKWKANASGVSATSFDLFLFLPSYTLSSHYVAEIDESSTWTDSPATGQVDPGSGSATVCVSSAGYNILAGNVGIGTTTPAYKLDVNGTMKSAGLYDSNNRLLLIKDSSGTVVWGN